MMFVPSYMPPDPAALPIRILPGSWPAWIRFALDGPEGNGSPAESTLAADAGDEEVARSGGVAASAEWSLQQAAARRAHQ